MIRHNYINFLEGVDYRAENVTLSITENSNYTFHQFYVELYDDYIVEGNESFSLHLSSSDSKVILDANETVITIIDLDQREYI